MAEKGIIRRDHPELWADLVAAAREIVGDWTEDQIAAVMNKVRAPAADVLMDHIFHVLCWCAAAQRSGDEEAIATVEIWQMDLPIEIFAADDGGVTHRLDPDVDVRIEHG